MFKVNKTLYYILNFTWGILLTAAGAFVALALLCTGHKPYRHAGCIFFDVGKDWGGFSLGIFCVVDIDEPIRLKNHEYGHSLQNAILGPLMLIFVSIPSAIRYWIFTIRRRRGRKNPPYDSIWFEGLATAIGNDTASQW